MLLWVMLRIRGASFKRLRFLVFNPLAPWPVTSPPLPYFLLRPTAFMLLYYLCFFVELFASVFYQLWHLFLIFYVFFPHMGIFFWKGWKGWKWIWFLPSGIPLPPITYLAISEPGGFILIRNPTFLVLWFRYKPFIHSDILTFA